MMRRVDAASLAARISALDGQSLYELRDSWREYFGDTPPTSQSATFLRQECAWRLQVQIYGDLDRSTRRRLATLARWRESDRAATSSPRVGATLLKEWNGAVHTVKVTEEGYQFDGSTYASLSAVARKITGVRWSGPRFFGMNAQNR